MTSQVSSSLHSVALVLREVDTSGVDEAGERPTPWTPPVAKIESPYRAGDDANERLN